MLCLNGNGIRSGGYGMYPGAKIHGTPMGIPGTFNESAGDADAISDAVLKLYQNPELPGTHWHSTAGLGQFAQSDGQNAHVTCVITTIMVTFRLIFQCR